MYKRTQTHTQVSLVGFRVLGFVGALGEFFFIKAISLSLTHKHTQSHGDGVPDEFVVLVKKDSV